jgi:hypothetical protein
MNKTKDIMKPETPETPRRGRLSTARCYVFIRAGMLMEYREMKINANNLTFYLTFSK